MTGTTSLTRPQFDALGRLMESITDSADIKRVSFTPSVVINPDRTDYVRVVFDAGYGTATYDIDTEGNSAQVTFSESEISQ